MAQYKFEDAMKRLEEITHRLEKGDLTLDESLKAFEEGMKLTKFCSDKLEEAEQKVTKLIKEGDNKFVQKPFEIEDEGEGQ